MKSFTHSKGKAASRVSPQQISFELKHRVVLVLNKLADRDTYQIAAEELEKIAEGLNPDLIGPFLSCIIDTDSEQKSAVRKECIRIMGTLARFHGDLLAPYLGKMVGSIVKRLKDTDSVVRDACAEAVGVLSSIMSNFGAENGGSFAILAKPLFEALGEQNRYVQIGSALCLAKVIDNVNDPPVSVLMRMLTRIIKLLKNQLFMAKPALIELVRSIIQVGGASTEHALLSALTCIQDTLKSSDWTTRKAASVALAGIAVNGGPLLGSFKASCIRSLELCRFDKVKPVRDSAMQAIQCWKNVAGPDSPEPSEAGSSTKENFCDRECSDRHTSKDGGWKVDRQVKGGSHSAVSGSLTSSSKRRSPLAVRKASANCTQNRQHSATSDWHIEVALPKTHSPLADVHNEESEGSCVTKTVENTNANTSRAHDIRYDYEPVDDMPETSTISDLVSASFETKHVTVARSSPEGDLLKAMGGSHGSPADEIDPENICSQRMRERKSMESTVTELSSQAAHGCCSHNASELASIRKQLLEIESKQSSLMDLIQVFMGNSMCSLSQLQSKVLSLERTVDKIAIGLTHAVNNGNPANSKFLKSNQTVSSPRFSSCTPRPSFDATNRHSSVSTNSRDLWDDTSSAKSRSSDNVKQGLEAWKVPAVNLSLNHAVSKGVGKRSNAQNAVPLKLGNAKVPASKLVCNDNIIHNLSESKNNLWKCVKDFLHMGDTDSAFLEAICSGDELILIELMDRTGPVLERLSHGTVCEILGILANYLLEQRFLSSVIPWLHQMVDLSTTCGPNSLELSAKAKGEFLSTLQEASSMNFSDPAHRRLITQLALKLRNVWGKCN
ncbi:TORTIFOLIA1-like protein 2 [Aristolochia californica]|uniref:TORTIFOLIA1-like protein 2 n=1 Tax=Aristolochia californica TaxID=171875 RepID=UPI0035DE8846